MKLNKMQSFFRSMVSGVPIVSGESVTNLLKIVEPELRMQLGGDLEL